MGPSSVSVIFAVDVANVQPTGLPRVTVKSVDTCRVRSAVIVMGTVKVVCPGAMVTV